ncbi:hypothetical protein L1987_31676 [Smallanthus sonchifolius]|uniref:Uncharacterized protein n=1 Tax=Smallanthus sonchifolius TaxID=185202 RepID=A0ACB9I7M7_9ASTR|nr:hypothetical protein L1987_31676 [Smallanthus sonchifolius]
MREGRPEKKNVKRYVSIDKGDCYLVCYRAPLIFGLPKAQSFRHFVYSSINTRDKCDRVQTSTLTVKRFSISAFSLPSSYILKISPIFQTLVSDLELELHSKETYSHFICNNRASFAL